MRQIFSSPRLANVEGVAKLLDEAGIENKISEARGYKKVSRREFSYVPTRQDAQSAQPSVWVVKSEDYKRARELLLAAGLLDETRTASSYLPEPLLSKADKPTARNRVGRLRLVLLFGVGAMVCWTLLRMFLLR